MKSISAVTRSWIAALVVAALLVSPRTNADGRRRSAIALVEGGGGPELEARLRAELSGIGWRVVETDPAGEASPAKIASRAGTLAVVRIGRDGTTIELWVAPEVSAQADSEWVEVDAERPALAIVRAVEALRARFLELGIEPEAETQAAAALEAGPKEDEPARRAAPEPAGARVREPASAAQVGLAPDITPAASASEKPSLWLRAQAAVSGSPGGLGIIPEVVAGGRFRPGSTWSVGAEVWLSPGRASVSGDGGSARLRHFFGALSLEAEARGEPLFGGAGLGLGGALFDVEGEADAGYRARRERITALVPFARVLGGVALTPRIDLRLDACVGVSVPRARVVFDGTDVAFWGRPLLAAGLGLDFGL